MKTKTHLVRISLMLGLLAGSNAFADDFNTVLKPAQQDIGYAEQSLQSVTIPRMSGSCGWSINDYVRNCSRAKDALPATESLDAAVKS